MCAEANGKYRQTSQRLVELQEEVEVFGEALWEIGSLLADIKKGLRSWQHNNFNKAQEHDLRNRMAEVDHQLSMTSKGEEMDQQFIYAGTRFKRVEGPIREEMKERSCKAWLDVFTTDKDAEEHNALHHQCYAWLRRAKRNILELESSRLCAQARQHAVNLCLAVL